jgi:hypothetical protein
MKKMAKKIKILLKLDPKISNFSIEKVYEMRNFLKYCALVLDIKGDIILSLINNKHENLETLASYAYLPEVEEDEIFIRAGGRHIVDIMRSVAHELVHKKQKEKNQLRDGSGKTGSAHENEANSVAGIIMRDYTKKNKHILDL